MMHISFFFSFLGLIELAGLYIYAIICLIYAQEASKFVGILNLNARKTKTSTLTPWVMHELKVSY